MKTQLHWVIVLVFLISSCTKEGAILRREDKLVGAWEIEKVTYKRDVALFATDVTDDYMGDIMEFFPDFTAIYDDYSLGEVFDGDWRLLYEEDAFWSEDAEISDLDFHLDATFYDHQVDEEFYFFGDINRLGRNKLHFDMLDRRGEFRFRLRRL
ncbi:MAG: hypothetical protein KTR24_04205 [Saprospiraceae bacterium]|nr:hypothetical protein [Saprospiraceae bacterium]